MANKLSIQTLGTVAITLNGRSLDNKLSRKMAALLIYLACHTRPTSRELLTTLFWPDSSPEQGLTNLRKLLSELRRLLPGQLTIERQAVSLNTASSFWLDAAALRQRLQTDSASPGALAEAAALYQGAFLAGLALPDSPDFMAWAAVQREQLQQMVINALHRLSDLCLQQRQYEAGVAYARQLVHLEPLAEAASRRYMLLLARSGQVDAALAEFDRCRQQLADALGAPPTAKTLALAERIQTAVTTPPNLPTLPTLFVGRHAELNQVHQHLAQPDGRWLTITGPGGVGKSRLALQAARESMVDFLHGVHYVSAAAVDSPAVFFSAVAGALNVPLSGQEPAARQIINYLRHKELLLLLDDAESLLHPALAEAADLLPAIVQQAPQVKLLLTSRERFNYQAEQVLSLAGLPAGDEAAVTLFLNHTAPTTGKADLSEEMLATIHHICQLVDGLPLGIELAAANMAAYSPQQIAQKISQTIDFLRRDAPTDLHPDRHRSLRAVFTSAWQQLSAPEQALLARLAIFPTRFSAALAQAVADAAPGLLLGLLDKSILQLVEGRYQMHALLRQFGREQLADETAVQIRFGRYYADFLQEQGQWLGGSGQAQALQAINAEIDNVRAAWQWLLAYGRTAEINQALSALHRFYDMRGWFWEGERSFQLGVEIWQTREKTAESQQLLARLLARLGFFQERLSAMETAVATLQQSLTILQEYPAPLEEAFVLNHLGLATYNQGAYPQAEAYYQQSLVVSRHAQDLEMEAITLVNLGALQREQGDYQAARQLINQSLPQLRRSGDQRQLSIALQTLGRLDEAEGAYAEAQAHYRHSLAICEQLNDRLGRAILCSSLANLALHQKALPEAQAWAHQALSLFEEIGEPWGRAFASVRLGELALTLAEYDEAQNWFQTSLALCQEAGDQRGAAVSLCNLGLAALGLARRDEAGELFGQALALGARLQFWPLVLKALTGSARLLVLLEQHAAALALAAFVKQHPAADGDTRETAVSLTMTLANQLTAEAASAAQEQARQWEMTAVLAAVQVYLAN